MAGHTVRARLARSAHGGGRRGTTRLIDARSRRHRRTRWAATRVRAGAPVAVERNPADAGRRLPGGERWAGELRWFPHAHQRVDILTARAPEARAELLSGPGAW